MKKTVALITSMKPCTKADDLYACDEGVQQAITGKRQANVALV
jgi:hypothetical protein